MFKRSSEDDALTTTIPLPRWSSADNVIHDTATESNGHVSRDGSRRFLGTSAVSERTWTGLQLLGLVGVVELLDQDARPTFVVDLNESTKTSPPSLKVIFINTSLRADLELLEAVTSRTDGTSTNLHKTESESNFRKWVAASTDDLSTTTLLDRFTYCGLHWTCMTLKNRLRVVSGLPDIGDIDLECLELNHSTLTPSI